MTRQEIKERIEKLEEEILDVKGRMPAHSVKPHIMRELFEREDEKAELEVELKRLSG
ncbi:histidine kinase [Desulfopila sp. IMCC35008]|uniref:histidine kinase n=1 Tax=Desulfopila sp. IMCC35008 TaxID=2653858 RepID=UPI0013D8C0CE|nr:histidine kinase [Desulfopila sp. IMCC35008]